MILALLILALLCLVAAYVRVASRIKRPEILLYVYVGLWLIFPKALRLTYLTGGRYDFPRASPSSMCSRPSPPWGSSWR